MKPRISKKELSALDGMLVKLQSVVDHRRSMACDAQDVRSAERASREYEALVQARAVVDSELTK